MKKYFTLNTESNFNLMNIIKNGLYYNVNNCLKL